VFRGGVQAEFQRMLPVEGADDLFYTPPPSIPSYTDLQVRPYITADESAVYELCGKTGGETMEIADTDSFHSNLIADKLVGGFLTLSQEFCFVLESSSQGLCGYTVAALDAKAYTSKLGVAWTPSLCKKYPQPNNGKELKGADKIIDSFHNEEQWYPEILYPRYPSLLHVCILPEKIQDLSLAKHLLACALSALKGAGSTGVYTEVNPSDKAMLELYTKLGFFDLHHRGNVMILGRLI